MRVMVLGSAGQLGQALMRAYGEDAVGYDFDKLDIRNRSAFVERVAIDKPTVVINTAAMLEIPACQSDPSATFYTNTLAVDWMATVCDSLHITFCSISSSYVFDGTQRHAYTEDATPNPINVYGASKLAADYLVPMRGPNYFIFRLTNLFGGTTTKGATFIDRIIQRVKDGHVPTIGDVLMSPSHVDHVADAMKHLIANAQPGLYNVASDVPVGLYFFVARALNWLHLPEKMDLVRHTDPLRPRNSALDVTQIRKLGVPVPAWDRALFDHLEKKWA